MSSYIIIGALSLLLSIYGFILEVTKGNIVHLENGREPSAGAAFFPTIPIVQVFHLVALWAMDLMIPGYGAIIVSGYIIFTAILITIRLIVSRIKIKELINETDS